MDFDPSDELRLIRDTARDFARNEVAPTADARDREHRFPREEFRKAAELGFAGMLVPEELGGSALGALALTVVIEEVSRACASTGVTLSVHNSLVCSPIVRHGSDALKSEWLPRLASGELLGAYALSEANAGSDAAALQCKARSDGGDWILDGAKLWITSGNEADVIIVFARAGEGITAFLVETSSAGFGVGKVEEKLGIRSSSTVEIVLDGVRVPGDRVLGTVGKGLQLAFDTLDGGRIGIAAQAVGIAAGAYERSVAYARERKAFGVPIGQHQMVQWMIADMATAIDGARLMTLKAATLKDAGTPFTKEASMAKLFAAETAMKVATDAVQVHGGYGYIREAEVERYFRDAKITQIYEGTSQIQKLVIAREVLK
jgi:acyl-CoA dehydrogenase